MKKHYYTYDNISNYVLNLRDQIVLSNYQPDLIVGIARGGLVPAVELSHLLNKPLKSITVATRDIFDERNDLDGKDFMTKGKLLVVDDICDSGKTLEIVKETFDQYHFEARYACVFNRVGENNFNLDYCGHQFEGDDWIVFPWEGD